MKQEALQNFPAIELMAVAFFLFLITFVGMIFWIYRKSAKPQYDQLAQAPLKEDVHG
jgi:cbb3-type cytochrome oxidase subunit 3